MAEREYAILVVDDDSVTRHLLVRLLTREGYRVTEAADGEQALQLLDHVSFDLVVLDLEMPEVNGLEILMNLRQTHSLSELPIVVVSGRDQTGDMVATLRLGANDYVTKPIHFPLFLSRVQNQLALKRSDPAPSPLVPSIPESAPASVLTGEATAPGGKRVRPAAVPAQPNDTSEAATAVRGRRETADRRREDTLEPARANAETPIQWGATRVTTATPLTIAEYEILSELGRGGMGVVYKARHLRMQRLVAFKVIGPEFLHHPDAVRRFYREVQAAAQLSHPNIVMAYDAGEAGNAHYLAMEHVEGTDLGKLLKERGPLPIPQASAFVRQVAAGLWHAHLRGMVHRDIKPSNLLVAAARTTRDGLTAPGSAQATESVVKILDMGLALLLPTSEAPKKDSKLTGEGRWLGTVEYLAPEQASDPHHVDARADLYSLGCTFYEMLTGRVPFPDGSPMEKALSHMFAEPTPVERLRPDVPVKVAAVVQRLLAKRRELRYQNALEVCDALH